MKHFQGTTSPKICGAEIPAKVYHWYRREIRLFCQPREYGLVNVIMPNIKILLAACFDMRYSARMLFAVKYLNKKGYSIDLITQDKNNRNLSDFENVTIINTWEKGTFPEDSDNPNRIFRIAANIFNKLLNRLVQIKILSPNDSELQRRVYLLKENYDLIWAVNLDSMPSVINGAEGTKIPVVYETLDLVAEYPYDKKLQEQRRNFEREYLSKVSALITAGNEYARYYREQYSYGLRDVVV